SIDDIRALRSEGFPEEFKTIGLRGVASSFRGVRGMSVLVDYEGFQVVIHGAADEFFIEEAVLRIEEFAAVLLTEPTVADGGALFLEKGLGDARALAGGNAEAGPAVAAVGPLVIEEA